MFLQHQCYRKLTVQLGVSTGINLVEPMLSSSSVWATLPLLHTRVPLAFAANVRWGAASYW